MFTHYVDSAANSPALFMLGFLLTEGRPIDNMRKSHRGPIVEDTWIEVKSSNWILTLNHATQGNLHGIFSL